MYMTVGSVPVAYSTPNLAFWGFGGSLKLEPLKIPVDTIAT